MKIEKQGLIIIDGPSGSGKTTLVKTVLKGRQSYTSFTYEGFIELLIKDINQNSTVGRESLRHYRVVVLDDIDLMKGKTQTQIMTARLIQDLMNNNVTVIIIGIMLRNRTKVLLSRLRANKPCWIHCKKENLSRFFKIHQRFLQSIL